MRSQFRRIEEYLATSHADELFSCEIDATTRPDSSWLASRYYQSKSLWRNSAVIPELAEGIPHESDTDEETPKFKRQKPPNFKARDEKGLRKQQKYQERLTGRNLGL
jgi:hypothetical protein